MPTWLPEAELLASRHVQSLDPDAVVAVFDTLEERVERFHGRAWAPRDASVQRRGDGSRSLFVDHVACRSLTAVTIDAATQDVADFRLWRNGRLDRDGHRFDHGTQVDVDYSHGADEPPGDLLDAIIRATSQLVAHQSNSRVGERTETLETPGGTIINFAALPDWERGRPLGMPDVDMVVASFGRYARPAIA